MTNERFKILAVDDYEDNLIILAALIEEFFPMSEIYEATDGKTALDIARKEEPDVVILDVFMPGLDGFEVCRELKKDNVLKDVPVLFVTAAKGNSDIRVQALEAGAEAFLAKPIDEAELTAQINAMLKIRKANLEKVTEKERLAEMVQEKTVELIEAGEVQNRLMDKLRIENVQRKKNEEALEIAKKAAEEANLIQSKFLANMSHEVRTPLSGIIGMIDMALMTELTDEQQGYMNTAMSSAKNLLRILNDILDYSKIEANRLEISNDWFDLEAALAMSVQLFSKAAEDKGVALALRTAPGVPNEFYSDEVRLGQILGNLISNAIKFTDQGNVELKISFLEVVGDEVKLKFEVTDSGIGIPKDKQALIFKRFSQVEGRETKGIKGSGLGLAISKNLVELMGGEMGFDSIAGRGSCFWFTLTGKNRQHAEDPLNAVEIIPRKILVVDDDPVNLKLMTAYLSKRGHVVVTARDGSEGIDTFTSVQPEVVLMDVSMPVMDGYEAVTKMKSIDGSIPVIAMTAYASEGEAQICLSAGFDSYIAKPIDFEALDRELKRKV